MLLIVLTVSLISLLYPTNREFKNLRRLLQGEHHFAFIKSLVIAPLSSPSHHLFGKLFLGNTVGVLT